MLLSLLNKKAPLHLATGPKQTQTKVKLNILC